MKQYFVPLQDIYSGRTYDRATTNPLGFEKEEKNSRASGRARRYSLFLPHFASLELLNFERYVLEPMCLQESRHGLIMAVEIQTAAVLFSLTFEPSVHLNNMYQY